MTQRDGLNAATVLVVGARHAAMGANPKPGTPGPSSRHGAGSGRGVRVGSATRTGSTLDVARVSGETLAQRGMTVDVRPLREHPSLDGDVGVVQGGVRLPEAASFVQEDRPLLAGIPTALFCMHGVNPSQDASLVALGHAFGGGCESDCQDWERICRWAMQARV